MGLGEAVYQQFELGNLPSNYISAADIQWRHAEDLHQQLKKINPTLVLNALPLDLLESASIEPESYRNWVKWIGQWCEQQACTLIQLSTVEVFADNEKRAFDENDIPTPESPLARELYALEQCLPESLTRAVLLRFAWLINTKGVNPFTQILSDLVHRGSTCIEPRLRIAPVWLDDALRVTVTLVRQILAGADNWGIFHYASSDACSQKEFAQQVLDSLDEILPTEAMEFTSVDSDQQNKSSAVLKCRRIRNNFGVHGRTWRQGLKSRIQFWLDSNAQANLNREDSNNNQAQAGVITQARQETTSLCTPARG